MNASKFPSEGLLTGRRRIEELDFCHLLKDLEWNDSKGKWVLHCQIVIPEGSLVVPQKTEWFLLIDDAYPWGKIDIYPGKENSIVNTFNHQNYNAKGASEFPWREGHICCSAPELIREREAFSLEPINASERLLWYFKRMRDWLMAAVTNQLIKTDDPFELPHFPKHSDGTIDSVVFDEDTNSLRRWEQIDEKNGLAELEAYDFLKKHVFVKAFLSKDEKELFRPNYGKAFSVKGLQRFNCIWIRMCDTPVMIPWQVPVTWGELYEVFESQKLDLKSLLRPLLKFIRKEKKQLLLLGFPMPNFFGGEPVQMHWQALKMPELSKGEKNGFRPVEKSWITCDFSKVLTKKKKVKWCQSENWHPDQISTRGRYPAPVLNLNVVLIGAGALGSMFAELLVRAGVHTITVIDKDNMEIGNLVRHTLDIKSIGYSKAEALSERLNLINPNCKANALEADFSVKNETVKDLLTSCDLVVDCTASDFVINQMASYSWKTRKIFVSLSVGVNAKRLFMYFKCGTEFDEDGFHSALKDWMDKDKEEFNDTEFPWEGIGCWHPKFPARVDDLWMQATMASKVLVEKIEQSVESDELIVFEQQFENNRFVGIKRFQIEGNGYRKDCISNR